MMNGLLLVSLETCVDLFTAQHFIAQTDLPLAYRQAHFLKSFLDLM